MSGTRRGPVRIVGMLAVLLWGAGPWLAAETDKSKNAEKDKAAASSKPVAGSNSVKPPAQPRVSAYMRAAQAARARTHTAARESSVLSNDDLPDLRYLDERQQRAEPPTRSEGTAGEISEPAPSAAEPPPVGSSQQPERAPAPLEWLEQRRARSRQWKQQLAQAESDRRAAEQRVAQLEREQLAQRNPYAPRAERESGSKGGDPAERRAQLDSRLKQAREELAKANATTKELRAQNPDG